MENRGIKISRKSGFVMNKLRFYERKYDLRYFRWLYLKDKRVILFGERHSRYPKTS